MTNLLSSFSPASDVTVIVKVVGFSDNTVQRKTAKVRERVLKSDNYFFTSLKLNLSRTDEENKLLIQYLGPFKLINITHLN